MIKYELAKKLKDAGFEQGEGKYIHPSVPEGITSSPYLSKHGDYAFVPTLSELIEACGELWSLEKTKQSPEDDKFSLWRASSLEAINIEKLPNKALKYIPKYIEHGKTPEEAVAMLYLKLHE